MSPMLDRPDFQVIAGWVQPGERVLDLGCGDGSLLKLLIETRGAHGYGVDIDDANVLAAIGNGVNVIQGNLDTGLAGFADDAFDHVVLSRTLQTVRHTREILVAMLRVGREAVVSFPNFGYWKNRLRVLLGNMPVSRELPYQWYDTPNIHLCTLRDFETFCRIHQVTVLERRVMTGEREVGLLPNLLGSTAVYRFRRAT